MEGLSKIFDQYCSAMNYSNKGNEIGVYSVALIGLSIAMRRVRPFSRFTKPSDVPNLFIQKRRELSGIVKRIEPNGGYLMVQHKPLIGVPSNEYLPVKISGVNVTGNGINWLQAIVSGNEIKFIPVAKETNCLQCEVVLPQVTHVKSSKPKKGSKKKLSTLNIGEQLILIGFGSLQPPRSTNVLHLIYMNRLKAAEVKALRKQLGIKYYINPLKIMMFDLIKRIIALIQRTQQKRAPVPKLSVT